MANWGAFSRDFAAAANSTARTVGGLLEQRERLDLAWNADRRASAAAGREAQSAADQRAAAIAEAGDFSPVLSEGVAAKAVAPGAVEDGLPVVMGPPSKLGMGASGPSPADDFENDPAANEAFETQEAKRRGFTPAPPSVAPETVIMSPDYTGPESGAPEDMRLGGPKERDGGIPKALIDLARKGNPAAAARIRELKTQAREQANKDREFGLRQREVDDVMKTRAMERQRTQQLITKEDYEQAKVKVQDATKSAMAIADNLRVPDETPLSQVSETANKLVDVLKQGYDATPDGRAIDVTNNNGVYVVKTIDEKTGKTISTDTFKTVGELKAATMMLGQIGMGENLGTWIGSTSLDAISDKARNTAAGPEINKWRDAVGNATLEQRMDPAWQAEQKQVLQTLSAKYPDLAFETIDVPVKDAEGNQLFDNNNKPVTRKEKRNVLAHTMDMLQPNTTMKTADGQQVPAEAIIQNIVANPAELLARAGGSVPVMLGRLKESIVAGGVDEAVANILVSQVASNLPQALQGALAQKAMPRSTESIAQPVKPGPSIRSGAMVNPRNPSQGMPRVDAQGNVLRNRAGIPLTQ